MKTYGRNRILPALLVSATLALPASMSGQDKASRVRALYTGADLERIERIVADARDAGVPVGPLYDKALEGAAKGVPATRVLPAVEAFAGRLRSSRDLVGATANVAAVVAGADALQKGVAPETIRSVGEAGGERTAVALTVMSDLVESGLARERALQVVREALVRTRDEEGLLDVPTTLRRLVREGAIPRDAARDMLRAMQDGIPLRRVRHRPGGDRPGGVRFRPVPPDSDPARDRTSGTSGRSGS